MTDKIKKGKVVGFSYVLTDSKGTIIDKSDSKNPFEYMHGLQQIVPGLERELEGLSIGDKKKVEVQPQDGYGVHDTNLILEVPSSNFPAGMKLEVGMEFQSNGEGGPMIIVIKEVKADTVIADANHPLAGQVLHFDIAINSIREATEQEIAHGHVHHGGHNH